MDGIFGALLIQKENLSLALNSKINQTAAESYLKFLCKVSPMFCQKRKTYGTPYPIGSYAQKTFNNDVKSGSACL